MKASIPLLATLFLVLVCGCEDDEYSHVPASGLGALIIDNDHIEDVDLFIDGERIREIKDGRDSTNDLPPGLYRVVLVDDDGLSYRDDIDIIEGRLTILEVNGGVGELDVSVILD